MESTPRSELTIHARSFQLNRQYTGQYDRNLMAGEVIRNICVNLFIDPDTVDGVTSNVRVFLCPPPLSENSTMDMPASLQDSPSDIWHDLSDHLLSEPLISNWGYSPSRSLEKQVRHVLYRSNAQKGDHKISGTLRLIVEPIPDVA